ncbi:hypothetical protein FHR22_000101 [Sphingopyxis panaciterrae]|uniref:hypothetical protein n=1 Tax=Sphingopyxis panaciterrae TaxID=363841 RepID=UPI001420957B|nr:hypothetical protein [Sphingopyxis panaciterrae]NIJ35452.1 hypothetical protein [Sphingopyxis panaciterrae]
MRSATNESEEKIPGYAAITRLAFRFGGVVDYVISHCGGRPGAADDAGREDDGDCRRGDKWRFAMHPLIFSRRHPGLYPGFRL